MIHFLWANHFTEASHSLRSNRARSILTGLGIAIGVACVTVILSLAGGVMRVVSSQVENHDGRLLLVRPGTQSRTYSNLTSAAASERYASSTLTQNDVTKLSTIAGVEYVAPIMSVATRLQTTTKTIDSATVIATTPALAHVTDLPIYAGQFIDDETTTHAAVLGIQTAIDLFGTETPIGQTFTLKGQRFTVIGVLKRHSEPINYDNIDYNHVAIINLKSVASLTGLTAQIQQIDIATTSAAQIPEVTDSVSKLIASNHGGDRDFTILSGAAIAEPSNQLFTTIASSMVVIAAISLLVGGIGIMNIMLVSVTERTREIGLRKAVGASRAMIAGQFLVEALLISLAGGIGGFIGGYAIAFAISSFLPFLPAFSWQIGLIALALSVGIGTLFGLYPAIRAARKDPIEALRHTG